MFLSYVDFTTNILLLFSITKTGTHLYDHCNFVDTHDGPNPKIYPKIIKAFCILTHWNRFNAPIKVSFFLRNDKTSIEEKKIKLRIIYIFSLGGKMAS